MEVVIDEISARTKPMQLLCLPMYQNYFEQKTLRTIDFHQQRLFVGSFFEKQLLCCRPLLLTTDTIRPTLRLREK